MAKQVGLIKLEGTIGDITYVKTKKGFMARQISRVSRERIMTDPMYKRTRENMADFKTAAQKSKVIRTALATIVGEMKDDRMANRLFSAVYGVLKQDTVNARGQRQVLTNNLVFLRGFEFNGGKPFSQVFVMDVATTIDRVTGEFEFIIPTYIPADNVKAPIGATHYQLTVGGVEVDLVDGTFVRNSQQSAMLPLTEAAVPALTLTCPLTPNGTLPLLTGIGIQFYQEFNGSHYRLNDQSFNAFVLNTVDV